MRIIAGEFKSRPILSPPDDAPTRPIPDRVKESLFGLLRGHFEGAAVMDVFAGTGSIGLEALSRGAGQVVFVERSREVAALLRENIKAFKAEDRTRVVVGDALGPAALTACPRPAHLIFFDPPYDLLRTEIGRRRAFTQFARLVSMLDDTGFAMLRTEWPFEEGEEGSRTALSLEMPGAKGPESHIYRHTAVHLYMKDADAPAADATSA